MKAFPANTLCHDFGGSLHQLGSIECSSVLACTPKFVSMYLFFSRIKKRRPFRFLLLESVVLDRFMSVFAFALVVHLPKVGSQCKEPCGNYKNQKWHFRNPGHLNARVLLQLTQKNHEKALRKEKSLAHVSYDGDVLGPAALEERSSWRNSRCKDCHHKYKNKCRAYA